MKMERKSPHNGKWDILDLNTLFASENYHFFRFSPKMDTEKNMKSR